MTSTSKSAHIRDVAVSTGSNLYKTAKVFSAGSAGIGLQLATRGYGLARRELERRKLRRAAAPTPTQRVSSRNKKLIAAGTVVGVVAAIAVVATKRRHAPVPPADGPPSLDDYAETPTSVNGSSASTAHKNAAHKNAAHKNAVRD